MVLFTRALFYSSPSVLSIVVIKTLFKSMHCDTKPTYPLQLDTLPPLNLEEPVRPNKVFNFGFEKYTNTNLVRRVNRDPLLRFAVREGFLAPLAGFGNLQGYDTSGEPDSRGTY